MLQAHQRLGEFEILRLLGKGGMGEVYEAEQSSPRRRVALKVLASWLAQDEDALRRFLREAEVPAQLDHPNIVRIISTGRTEEGIAYYTMQMVRGISLSEMVRRSRIAPAATLPFPIRSLETPSLETPAAEAGRAHPDTPLREPLREETPALGGEYARDRYRTLARIGAAVARALAFAHQQGFVHRDLKPSNIMVDLHDHIYLLDFGLTRAMRPTEDGTQSGVVLGTPSYMSPEQAEGKEVDARSDIYSLGVTLFELATQGVGPYTASPQQKGAVLSQIRSGKRLPLRLLAPDIPPELERIIDTAMNFRPGNRYTDAARLATDLERFLEGSLRLSDIPPPTRPLRRASVLLGTACICIVLVLGWQTFRQHPAGQEDTHRPSPPEILPIADAKASSPAANPLPPLLVDRPWRVPVNLFTKQPVEPLWCAQLSGAGKIFSFPEHLNLASLKKGERVLLALDHDPRERWFDFNIELKPILSASPGQNELGVFFGWQPSLAADPSRLRPFLVIGLDKKKGEFQIACHYQTKPNKEGFGTVSGSIALPPDIGKLPLARTGPWHALRIQIVENRISVTSDDAVTRDFHVDALRRLNPVFEHLEVRGAVGIWTNGDAMFRGAQVMAIPTAKTK